MENEIVKLKVQDLVALRQLLMNNIIVLTGGLVGIYFTPNSFVKFLLLASGFWFLYVFVSNIGKVKYELNDIKKE